MQITRRTALASGAATLASGCMQSPLAAPAMLAGCWSSHAPLPIAVQEIYPAAHAGIIHICGGLLGENGRVVGVGRDHVAYDPARGTYAALGPLPSPRHHPHAISHKGRLYLFGGFGTNPGAVNWIMSDEAMAYDHGSWTNLAKSPGPNAEVVATSLGDQIHIVGGRAPKGAANLAYGDHADTDRHFVFDPVANSWSTAAPALTARNSAAGGVIDGLWHVAGGRHVVDGPSDAHEVYDAKEDRWRAAAPMPKGSGAGGNAAGVLNGQLYVFGGEYFHDGGKVHAEVWRYDPKADAWHAATPMPTPRHGLGALTIGDAIWLVGGAKKPSGVETTDAVERFTLSC